MPELLLETFLNLYCTQSDHPLLLITDLIDKKNPVLEEAVTLLNERFPDTDRKTLVEQLGNAILKAFKE